MLARETPLATVPRASMSRGVAAAAPPPDRSTRPGGAVTG
jgi:hypothetical protein